MFDGDFLELVWVMFYNEYVFLVIVLYGFEGNINSFYVKGMMKKFK